MAGCQVLKAQVLPVLKVKADVVGGTSRRSKCGPTRTSARAAVSPVDWLCRAVRHHLIEKHARLVWASSLRRLCFSKDAFNAVIRFASARFCALS
jgi:hypothetical protein